MFRIVSKRKKVKMDTDLIIYIIGEIENNLTSRGEQDLFDSYDDKMSEMKRMRVLADYEDAEITKDEAQACIDYADELLTDLKECYNIL